METPTFDPEIAFAKTRTIGKGVTYEQEGNLFNAGYNYLGPTDASVKQAEKTLRNAEKAKAEMKAIERKKKAKARIAARANLSPADSADSKLAGYIPPENPSEIEKAQVEDAKAVAAEGYLEI